MRIKNRERLPIANMHPRCSFKNKGKHYTIMHEQPELISLGDGEVATYCLEDDKIVIFSENQKGEVVDIVAEVYPRNTSKEE